MTKWGELTPATIIQIAFEVKAGEADPDDARRVLEHFCNCTNGTLQPELIRHLQDCLREYLCGNKTIEAAFGLARKKGRPYADDSIRQSMASAVLRNRLNGATHENAVATVSEEYGWGESTIKEAWRDNKQNALILLELERGVERQPWSIEERDRLTKIYSREAWFIPPEKSANKPA